MKLFFCIFLLTVISVFCEEEDKDYFVAEVISLDIENPPDNIKWAVVDPGSRGFNDKIDWTNNLKQGIEKAKEESKPIMLLIHNSACHACESLKKAFNDPKYGLHIMELSKNFININLRDNEEPSDDEYKPDGEYIPRLLFLDSNGKVIHSLTNPSNKYKYFYARAVHVVESLERAVKYFDIKEKIEDEKIKIPVELPVKIGDPDEKNPVPVKIPAKLNTEEFQKVTNGYDSKTEL